MNPIVPEAIEKYAEAHSTPEKDLHKALVKATYEKMQKPTRVIAVGACALSGSPYKLAYGSENQKIIKAEDIIPVDVYVPGCPPRPEALLSAVLELQRKISPGPTSREVLHEALK